MADDLNEVKTRFEIAALARGLLYEFIPPVPLPSEYEKAVASLIAVLCETHNLNESFEQVLVEFSKLFLTMGYRTKEKEIAKQTKQSKTEKYRKPKAKA